MDAGSTIDAQTVRTRGPIGLKPIVTPQLCIKTFYALRDLII